MKMLNPFFIFLPIGHVRFLFKLEVSRSTERAEHKHLIRKGGTINV